MLKVAFFGSSTVQGHGASRSEKRATSLVASALGWNEINLGIGGTTVAGRDEDGFLTSDDSGLARVPDVIAVNPDLVIVLYGANDFGTSVPLGDQSIFAPGTFASDYDSMVRGLVDALGNSKVVLSTLLYRADAISANTAGATLNQYNNIIKETAVKYDLLLLEPDRESTISESNFDQLSSDDTHLNDQGYQYLAAYYIEKFSTLGELSSSVN